jgi:hypothetical protein
MTKMDPIKASKFMLDRKKGTKKTVKNNKK